MSNSNRYHLLTRADTLSPLPYTGGSVRVGTGSEYVFDTAGTFGGATVTLQMLKSDESTWIDLVSHSAPNTTQVYLGAHTRVRAVVAGGSPSGLFASIS